MLIFAHTTHDMTVYRSFIVSADDVDAYLDAIHPNELKGLQAFNAAGGRVEFLPTISSDNLNATHALAFFAIDETTPVIGIGMAGKKLAGKHALVFHELVHYDQWKRGDLVIEGKTSYWKGVDQSAVKYHQQEAEIEAYARQERFERMTGMRSSFWKGPLNDLRIFKDLVF